MKQTLFFLNYLVVYCLGQKFEFGSIIASTFYDEASTNTFRMSFCDGSTCCSTNIKDPNGFNDKFTVFNVNETLRSKCAKCNFSKSMTLTIETQDREGDWRCGDIWIMPPGVYESKEGFSYKVEVYYGKLYVIF